MSGIAGFFGNGDTAESGDDGYHSHTTEADEFTDDEDMDDDLNDEDDDDDDDDVDPLALLAAARERTNAIPIVRQQQIEQDSEDDDAEYTTDEGSLVDTDDDDGSLADTDDGHDEQDEYDQENGVEKEEQDNDEDRQCDGPEAVRQEKATEDEPNDETVDRPLVEEHKRDDADEQTAVRQETKNSTTGTKSNFEDATATEETMPSSSSSSSSASPPIESPEQQDAETSKAGDGNSDGVEPPGAVQAESSGNPAPSPEEAADHKPAEVTDKKDATGAHEKGQPSKRKTATTDNPRRKAKSSSKRSSKNKRASKPKLEMLSTDEPLEAADLLAFAKRRTAMAKSLPSSRRHQTTLDLDPKQSFQLLAAGNAPSKRRPSQTATSDTGDAAQLEDSKPPSTPAGMFAAAVSNLEARRRSFINDARPDSKTVASDGSAGNNSNESPTKFMDAISNAKSAISAATASANSAVNGPGNYSLAQHAEYCNLRAEATINTTTIDNSDSSAIPKYFQYCDISHMLIYSSNTQRLANSVKDYVSPVPEKDLIELFCGLVNPVPPTSPGDDAANIVLTNVLPVRTLAIRIRPDVSGNVIVRAVQTAFNKQPGMTSVLKRDSSHFQGLVNYEDFPTSSKMPSSSFVIDAQLVTQAYSANLERRLLLRIYHPWQVYRQFSKAAAASDSVHGDAGSFTGSMHSASSSDAVSIMSSSSSSSRDIPLNLLLRQASSMIQYLHLRRRRGNNNLFKHSAKDMTQYLLSQYKEGPTVRTAAVRATAAEVAAANKQRPGANSHTDDVLLLPALSVIDWTIIQSSWTLLFRIWKELTQAKCEFSSLETLPLGSCKKDEALQTIEGESSKDGTVITIMSEEGQAEGETGETGAEEETMAGTETANSTDTEPGTAATDKIKQKAVPQTTLLDAAYIGQLRTIARNILSSEVEMVNQEMVNMEEKNEDKASNFISLMSIAYAKYELERPPLLEEEDDNVEVLPDGTKRKQQSLPIELGRIMEESADDLLNKELASITMARTSDGGTEQDGIPPNDPIDFCEYVVKRAYAALSKQADLSQAQYMREKNLHLMRRQNTLEIHMHTLIEHLYDHDNDWTMSATHNFERLAQKATNLVTNNTDNKKGRRLLKHLTQKQVPVFDFGLCNNGGHCYVTRTLFLVSTTGVLLGQTKLFELQQIYFEPDRPLGLPQSPRRPAMLYVYDVSTKKRLFKLKPEPTIPIERLLLFLCTMQEFQLKFYPMTATPVNKKFV